MQTLTPDQLELAKDIRDYVLAHPGMKITEKILIDKFFTSTHFLRILFPIAYEKTPSRLHMENKMRTAVHLFLTENENEHSIKNVAYTLGYSSPESFTHAFKKYYKMTPEDYLLFLRSINFR